MLKRKTEKQTTTLQTGSVLVAKPFWRDEQYQRSVILITEHDEEGSSGVIINKESQSNIHLSLKDLNITFPVYYGGPFGKNEIVSLHNRAKIPGCATIGSGLSIGTGYDILKEMISSGNRLDLTKIRFLSGHVNWSGGQLEQEINDGKWWTSEINGRELFNTKADMLWSEKLISDGHIYGMFHDVPEPLLN